MSGTNYPAHLQSVTSRGRRIHLGYMVSPHPPHAIRRNLTDTGTGHLWWWLREEVSAVEKSLLEEHGTVARWNGLLGVSFF